jgi:phage terminase large subunit
MKLRNFQSSRNRYYKAPAEVNWDYSPTARQREFHTNSSRYKAYGGAMGGGKSWALAAEAIKLSLKFPGNRGYMCRHTLQDFRRSTLVTFEILCPREFIKNHYRDDRLLEFHNGSQIHYGGLGGQEDLEKIKSTEFGWFAIDEASETFEEMFLLLCSRLRWKLRDGKTPKYRGLIASNPEPGWVKDRFVDQQLPDHVFIPALPRDNPHLPNDYDAKLRQMYPDEWVRRYLDGSWDVFEGQIYKEFDRKTHVYSNQEISPFWEKFRVIDHGYVNPTCCIWAAIDYDGRIWIYREHYERQLTVRENAEIIIAQEPKFQGLTLCDPSMFSNTQQKNGKACSFADDYREAGIVCISPYSDKNWASEGVGINLVKQRFKDNSLLIHESCKNGISEILKYRWRDLRVTDRARKSAPEVPVDKDNHFCDDLRYLCVWKPSGSSAPKKPEAKNTLHFAIMQHKKRIHQPRFAGWD